MSHYRADYRAAVTAAIKASPQFSQFRTQSAWVQRLDPDQLPCFAVATPREGSTREGGNSVHRTTTVQVAFRMDGSGDLETSLDDLSIVAEQVILEALQPLAHILSLAGTTTSIDAGGERPMGILIMEFTAIRFTDAGSLI
jgi:hypothetical protein